MRIDRVAARFERYIPLMRCPMCFGKLALSEGGVKCPQGHSYDFSAKGYVNLAPRQRQDGSKYTKELFENRRAVLREGYYQPILDAIAQRLTDASEILDAGCGEGWYSMRLAKKLPSARVIGVDLSRDAISLAANQPEAAFIVGDLTRLPVETGCMDAVIDVLTPADYSEYGRVLKKGGRLIKALPQSDYLIEIRSMLGDKLRGDGYSNERVLSHLQSRARLIDTESVRKTYELSEDMAFRFLRMTPMTEGLSESELSALPLPETITVDMLVVTCEITDT